MVQYNYVLEVEEQRVVGRSMTERTCGRNTRENAGMSNEKASENLARRKPKVSWGRLVHPG